MATVKITLRLTDLLVLTANLREGNHSHDEIDGFGTTLQGYDISGNTFSGEKASAISVENGQMTLRPTIEGSFSGHVLRKQGGRSRWYL